MDHDDNANNDEKNDCKLNEYRGSIGKSGGLFRISSLEIDASLVAFSHMNLSCHYGGIPCSHQQG